MSEKDAEAKIETASDVKSETTPAELNETDLDNVSAGAWPPYYKPPPPQPGI